ncbi:hypothetical protein IWQ62_004426 [Dispira parvispora]|uniref:Glucose-6-phosphate 1-epimerase n=1 Tax=Dispira parvispora TaxID=1520584 RepID=A0A9W8E5F0_9FUNG|nr:hypothetical protein IWQ62_004426 [Dispira parvispora]
MPVQTVSSFNLPTDKVILTHPTGASCEIKTFGATVTSWKVHGQERLFLSRLSDLEGNKPIRGGIPLVFPQFGKGPLMPGQHGFARHSTWEYMGVSKDDDSEIMVSFELRDSDATRASGWPYHFKLTYLVTLTATTLGTHLAVTNTDKVPIRFTALLHTYLTTPDISQVRIGQLGRLNYTDKVQNNLICFEERDQVTIQGETDRIYHSTPDTVPVEVAPGQVVNVKTINFRDTVVWNPWVEKAQAMADLDDQEYQQMICVESGSVHESVTLPSSQTWEAGQVLSVDSE